jgi:hypothetical protein
MRIIAVLAIVLNLGVANATLEDELALKDAPVGGVSAVGPSPADAQAYTDTNVGGPLWDRPIGIGPPISGVGPVNYSTQVFRISANDTCDITSVQDYDGYLHVYTNSFDPMDQITNLVNGNDDGSGGIGTSEILGQALSGGVNYTIVTSAFSAGQTGTFTNTITCPVALVALGPAGFANNTIPVPTLSPWGLLVMIMGVAGVLLYRRTS